MSERLTDYRKKIVGGKSIDSLPIPSTTGEIRRLTMSGLGSALRVREIVERNLENTKEDPKFRQE